MLPRLPYYFTLFLTFTLFVSIYIILLITIFNQEHVLLKKSTNVKSIVAYSLLKQIEIESEQYFCKEFVDVRDDTEEINNYSFRLKNFSVPSENQWIRVPETKLFIYSVYYDTRLDPFHYLRILGMVRGTENQQLFCQIQTTSTFYHITKATRTDIWSKDWNQDNENVYNNPVLFSCQVPNNFTVIKVNFSPEPCTIISKTFIVKIPQFTERFFSTVCVKPLDFHNDISKRLIQWIEINKILGADKFDVFIKKVHVKVWRVLQWYQKTHQNFRIIVHKNLKDVDVVSNRKQLYKQIWQKRRNELIPYNDCLYRNLYASQFVIPVDTDEIIVPRHVYTWRHLLNGTFSSAIHLLDDFASFTVQNAYYLKQFTEDPIKEKVFFLRDVIRSELSVEGESGKSFVSTRNALTVFNHYALHVLKPGINRSYFLPSKHVQMNHYKNTCSVELLPQCAKYLSSPVRIIDPVILKYKKQFSHNYIYVLNQLRKYGVL